MTVDQWELFGPAPDVVSGVAHGLRNRVNDRCIRYGERDNGIDLVWDRSPELRNIVFESTTPSQPIRFGDRVSIRVQDGGHLDYQERDVGINLGFTPSPTFQWTIGGGEHGGRLRPRQRIRLVNEEHGDHLVYGERDKGINLRWWADTGAFGSYPPLPMPASFRAPSGEPGQIQLEGWMDQIYVFHGGRDDELDWNLKLRLSPDDRVQLHRHLLAQGKGATVAHPVPFGAPRPLAESDLVTLECEIMVLDGYDNSTFDELFYSADVTTAFQLEDSAWKYSAEAGDEQNLWGASEQATTALRDRRVWVQGEFVNDHDHVFKVEVHPLDSLAYPLDLSGDHIDVPPGSAAWPTDELVWRIAAFTNSSFHRINGAEYVERDRRVRWYLPLPTGPSRFGWKVTERLLPFVNRGRTASGLDDRRPGSTDEYFTHGVLSHAAWVAVDPRDGASRLRVDITMARPTDRWGGMFLAEYEVKARLRPVIVGPTEVLTTE